MTSPVCAVCGQATEQLARLQRVVEAARQVDKNSFVSTSEVGMVVVADVHPMRRLQDALTALEGR